MPGDELVRYRLECSTSMYEQSTDILDRIKQGLSRFEHDLQNDFHTIVVRVQVRSSQYGLLRPSTIKHDFYSINWTFTGFTYGPTDFCSSPIPYNLFNIDTIELTRKVDLCGCIYGLVWSHTGTCTVSHGLSRSCTIANTITHGHGTRVSF